MKRSELVKIGSGRVTIGKWTSTKVIYKSADGRYFIHGDGYKEVICKGQWETGSGSSYIIETDH